MNRPLKLSLAVALALASSEALALGLGPIEVKSRMNEPLSADIVVEGTAEETTDLKAQLAGADDMRRVGMDTSGLNVPLDFTVMPGPRGRTVIHVTSSEPVRDPYISFLVVVNWGKGKLLREYNVLLDPPVAAPVIGTRAVAAPIKEPERAAPKPAAPAESKPAPAPAPSAVPPAAAKPEPAPAKPAPAKPEAKAEAKPETKQPEPQAEKPKPTPPAPPAPAPVSAGASGEYGPVASGETLWEIANRTKPSNAGVNQMMIALLSANPDAFYKDNVNALKRGAVMRIPGSDDVRKLTPAEAQAAVAAQNQAWAGGTAAPPVKVADSGKPSTPPPPAAAPASTGGKPSRLELVPPKAGTGKTGADKPGTAGGTDTSATSRADLARVKEQLSTKEQEATELRSRVSDLEKLKADNERLIQLKNTQIAELQTRLAELNRQIDQQKRELAKVQSAAPTAAAAPPAPAKAEPPKPEAAKPEPAKAEPPKPEPAKVEPPKTEPSATAIPPKAEPAKPEVTPSVVPPAPAPEAAKPAPSEPKITPLPESKPATPAEPPPQAEPWFESPLVLGGVGGALLLGALALLMGRRRKAEEPLPVGMDAPSLGDQFGTEPYGGPAVGAAAVADDYELELLERLAADPTDDDAHMALLQMYYERQDADKFEPAASAFYAQHPNPVSWERVAAMGRELLPGNLLFAEQVDDTERMPSPAAMHDEAATRHDLDFDFGLSEKPAEPPAEQAAAPELAPVRFDFDTPPPPSRVKSPEAEAEPDTGEFDVPEAFEFDTALDTPKVAPVETPEVADTDLDFTLEMPSASVREPEPAPAPTPVTGEAPRAPDFMGEDAVGTKLDLARAYMDMGDPDGAKSMLQEVLNEGSTSQREEARRLLDDLA